MKNHNYKTALNQIGSMVKEHTLLPLMVLFAFFILMQNANAQFLNVPVTGFNSDQVANGVGAPSASTTATADGGVDGATWIFIDGTYKFSAGCGVGPFSTNIVPANNQIASQAAVGLTYVLQSYSGNNALRVPATGNTTTGSGTLAVTTPVAAANLYLLCVSGNGAITSGITITVTFTDATTQVFSNLSTADWCNLTNAAPFTKITTTQYYRVQTSTAACTTPSTCQYFAELSLAISPANYSKLISSITCAKTTTSANIAFNTYAVGIQSPCTVPSAQPTALSSSSTTVGSISGVFTAASPAPTGTGGYLVVRYPLGAGTITSPANGTAYSAGQALGAGTVVASSSATTFTASGLSGSTSYDFYIYSYNSATTCGGPVYLTTSPLFNTLTTSACGSMSGIIPVGPGQPNTAAGFTTINNALTFIAANGLGGNTIIELQSGYTTAYAAANETTFPISFPLNPCINSSRTLTIRPAAGIATPIIITSNNATATVNFNGATYVTIDGRPGGSGTTSELTLINTSSTGVAIQFINDAQLNTVTYCDIQGQNTSATSTALSGVIYFSTANSTSLGGNDNNTISFSSIHATSGGFPAIGVCSFGSVTTTASWNDNNIIDNCNIFDFFSATLASTAVKCDGGSNAFTVSNNHIYQTATRNFTTANQQRAFWMTPTATGACGFQITGNFIGGNNASGTGTMTLTSSVLTTYWAMDINHTGSTPTSIQGNTITNISFQSTTTTANDLFRGISTGNTGNVNIGTVTGNIIGAATGNGAILLNGGSGSISYGIKNASTSPSTINISNNIIGSITLLSTVSAVTAMNFTGIATSGITTNINNNLVGSLTTANSINASNAATSTTQSVNGITVAAGTTTTVTNNTIANLNNNYNTNGAGLTRGIAVTASTTSTITGNTVRNLTSTSQTTGTGINSSLVGIGMTSANPSTVSGNTVHSLVATPAVTNAAIQIEGIVFSSNGSTPTNLVTKNLIHSLSVSVADSAAILIGMDILGGSNIIANNMIRLGIKPDGSDLTTNLIIRGIFLNATTAENIYFNSVYIGGQSVTGPSVKNSFAFQRNATSGTHDIENNIFVNNRSNAAAGAARHYAVYFTTSATGATPNYNVYQTAGTGGTFGTTNSGAANVTAYASGWVAGDINSITGNPQFINPTGTSAAVDLHINSSVATPVEGAGIALLSIADDYDSQSRGSLSPTDIGADAGNFIGTGTACGSITLNAGTASAANTTFACPGGGTTSLSLTGTNFSGVYGLSYQWQSRTPAGSGTFTNISGANYPVLNTSFAFPSTEFQCVVSCGANSATSAPVTVVPTTAGVAMGYSPITVTGYNQDVIANGNTGTANPPANSATAPVDAIGAASNTNFYFYDASYSFDGSTFPATSLPVNGQVVSSSVTGLLYKLKPASGMNVLQLRGGGAAGTTLTGTLSLTTPQSGAAVYLLAVSGNGASTVNVTVTFTDATIQTFTSVTVPDWFNVTPFSQGGFGRVNSFGFDGSAPGGNNPRMYDITLALSPSNYSKLVQSVTVTNTTAGASATASIANVFAVTMAVAAPTPFCGGLATSVTLFNPPSGATYQWQSSTTSGGPYTNVSGGTGATATTYTNGSLTGPLYYVCNVTCSSGGLSALSGEVFENINPVPTVSVSSSSASYCTGSAGVTLTELSTGATSFVWSPGAGLNTTSGTSVIASPSATTTYTVTALNSGGCSATATATVTTVAGPNLTSVTANPFAVLSGGTSTLTAVANQPTTISAYSFSQSNSAYTSLVGATVLGQSPTIDDDVNYAPVPLGFNFNYHGQVFSTLGISDNCYAALGAATITSYAALSGVTNVLAPLNADMLGNSATHQLRYLTSGVPGTRIFTVEWFHWGKYNVTGDEINVQLKLYEASGAVQFIYQPVTPATSFTTGVGINGTTVTDFLDRTTTGNWNATTPGGTNTATCQFDAAVFPANGLTFTFTPSASGLTYAWTPATFLNSTSVASPVASNVTASTTYTVTVSNAAGCSVSGSATVAISGMVYDSTVVTQVSSPSCTVPGALSVPVLRMAVWTDGLAGTINMDGFQVDLGGTANPQWVSNARIYYTGNSSVFATTTQYAIELSAGSSHGYGSFFMAPSSGTFPIGTFGNFNTPHYFWLAYDVYSGASACGGALDGQISMVQTDFDNIEDDVSGQMPVTGNTTVSIANNFAPTASSISTCAGTTLTWSRACGYTGNYDVYLNGNPIPDYQNTSGTYAITPALSPGTTYNWQVQMAGSAYETSCNLQTFQTAAVITPVASIGVITGPLTGVCGNTYTYSAASFNSTIQWQISSNNVTFVNLTGLTSGTAAIPANAGPGSFYIRAYAIASGVCSSDTAYSNVLTVVISAPSCSISSSTNANVCSGQSVTLTANGPSPYLWSTGQGTQSIVVTPGITTTYSVITGAMSGINPTSVTGFTADIVANGIGAANLTTTADFDGSGFYFLDSTYRFTSTSAAALFYMPPTHIVNSVGTPGVSYMLQSYSANNSLRLATVGGSGTLTLTSPQNATNIYLLAASGHGPVTINATVNFTDATSQTISGLSVPDWFDISPFAIQGINRVNTTDVANNTGLNPRLYDISLPINAGNYTKLVSNITITFSSQVQTGATANIMAVSILSPAQASCSCSAFSTITVGGPISHASVSPSTAQCPGTARILNAGTVNGILSGPVTYNWHSAGGSCDNCAVNVVNPSVTTTYTLTVSDGLCSYDSSIVVPVFVQPTVTVLNNGPVCNGATATLTATGISTTSAPGNYSVSSITYAPASCPSSAGPAGDDVLSSTLPIGFNFSYFGVNYTSFAICTNGNIQLGDGSGSVNNPAYSNAFTATALPAATVPNNLIAAIWADLNTANGGNITYGTSGSAPNRKLVVCYNGVGYFTGGGVITTQIILNESTNVVEVHVTSTGINTTSNRVLGVENQGGTLGSMPSGRGLGTWTANNEAWSFIPPSAGTYSWSGGTTPSNAASVSVTPSSTSTYSITFTDLNGCSASASTTVNVVLPTISCPADITVCNSANTCGYSGSIGNATVGVQPCTNTITHTPLGPYPVGITFVAWTVTDQFNNIASCVQKVTINDCQSPLISGVGGNSVVACPSAPVFSSPTASDNCSATLSFADVTTNGCGSTYSTTRTWTATDPSGNTSTASQTISVEDHTAPVISGAGADANIACPDVPVFSNPTATDACGTSTLTFTDVTVQNCGTTYSTTRTWTATDACGNVSTASQTIQVRDLVAPVIGGLCFNQTLECPDVPVLCAAYASDDCSTFTLSFADVTTPTCGNSYVITRTYTATDACGNVSTAVETATVEDITAPVIDNVGPLQVVMCPATPAFSTPTASDECSTAALTYYDETITFCTGSYAVTRHYTATDPCGNSSTADEMIIVLDFSAPTISGVGSDMTIECPASPAWSNPTSADGCSNSTLTFDDVTTGGCGGSYSTTRTWTATDDCFNSSSLSQTISVEDHTAPTILNVNANSTIECPASPNFGVAVATDACSNFSLTSNDVTTAGCGSSYSTTRTWTATDDCGNTSTASETISVEDHTGPVISGVGADQAIECPQAPVFSAPAAADACGSSTMTFADATTNGCGGSYTTTRTWTAVDGCGNTTTAQQTIHVEDHTGPVISGVGANQVIECPATPVFSNPTQSDACSSSSMAFATVTTNGCGTTYTKVRTWTATDACGNVTTASQTISVQDHTNPVISGVNPGQTIQCPATPNFCSPTASDVCNSVVLTYADVNVAHCGGTYTRTRTWTAIDACGNTTTASQAINVIDNVAPVITGISPAVLIIQCPATPVFGTGIAADACSSTGMTLTFNDVTTALCGGAYTKTRTWTATDGCGNVRTGSQTVNVIDNTAPVITGVAANATIACPSSPTWSTPTSTDACGTSAITYADVTTTICGGSYSRTRTWTATDACGNHSSASRTVTVSDLTPPVISGVGANQTIQCPATPVYSNPIATDACGSATIAFNDVTATICGSSYSRTRTWTATDACGNHSTASQTITVQDITAPVLSNLGSNATIQCPASPVWNTPIATDACGSSTVTFSDVTVNGCGSSYTRTRTWTATDGCGNASTASRTITVQDNTAPVISGVGAAATINCPATPSFSTATAADACGTSTLTSNDVTVNGTCPGNYTTTRTWTATDGCGNTSTASQAITVHDVTPPTISCPATIYLCASALSPALTNATGSDGCSSVAISHSVCPANFPTGTTVITWTATDLCGNTATCTQNVIRDAAITVSIAHSGDISGYCQGNNAATLTANAAGGTGTLSYLWSNGATTQSISVSSTGTYTVVVTDQFAAPCSGTASYVFQTNSTSALSSYTILAKDNVHLHGYNTVQNGGVGAATTTGSAEGGGAGWVKIHDHSTLNATTTFARAAGIQVDGTSMVMNQVLSASNAAMPAFDAGLPASNTNVTVPAFTTVTLNGTVYGDITVGQGATLIFGHATVDLKNLYVGQGATVQFTQSCTKLRMASQLDIDRNAVFNPDADGKDVAVYLKHINNSGSGAGSANYSFGYGSGGGALTSVNVEYGASVKAFIYAPDGKIDVHGGASGLSATNGNTSSAFSSSSTTTMKGLFIARAVKAHGRTNWNWNTVCSSCNYSLRNSEDDAAQTLRSEELNSGMLIENFPDPFMDKTSIRFVMEKDTHATVKVYDISGKYISTIFEGDVRAKKEYRMEFDGSSLASGMYIYKVITPEDVHTGKMMLIKE